MNAEDLDFPDGSFDLALCGFMGWDYCYDFVLDEFTGPDTRMQEICRVLRDGGRVGFSIWERQEDIEWLEATFLWHFPSLAPEADRTARGVRRETVYSRESAKGYVQILRRAGFRDVEIVSETADCVSAGTEAKEAWWEQMRSVGWDRPFEQVASLGSDRLPGFKEAVFRALERHMRADGIHFAKSVSFVFGTK
jgi:SAM-dependent methyltransferase